MEEMMRRIAYYFICALLLISACSKKSTKHSDPTFSVSGLILNQDNSPATDLFVKITDSQNLMHSAYTDLQGRYTISGIKPGVASIHLSSFETIIAGKLRYLEKDSLINISEDNVLNMAIREFHTIFHDSGNNYTRWIMEGGVRNDGQQYVFEDYWLQDDDMLMLPVAFPSNADENNMGFLIRGRAVPSGSSNLEIYVYINGALQDLYWDSDFSSSWEYHSYSLSQFPQVRGNSLRLLLWFVEYSAAYIYVNDIWIYNY
jgi:hypothetical protein